MERWIDELTYSKLAAWTVLWPFVGFGVVVFRWFGRTPWISYWAMRRLACSTEGRSNAWLGRRLGRPPTQPNGFREGVFSLDDSQVGAAVAGLVADGFSVLPLQLSAEHCDELAELALTAPARLTPVPSNGVSTAVYEPLYPLATRYDLPEEVLVGDPLVDRLIADDSFREIARRYLEREPVNDLVAMWWSTALLTEADPASAQLYHFDMDRPEFLKIFIYLTDVDTDTGPHCFIRGSNRTRPASLWRDGRHSDQEVRAAFGPESECEITGPRGSVIAVDTSGFHKGKKLEHGDRLVLQLEYTTALFGQSYEQIHVPASEFWRRELAENPYYLQRFSLEGSFVGSDNV